MNIVLLQHTFNPTTMGWVRGLEARGHRLLTIIANAKEPHGGWPEDLEVQLIPDRDSWSSLFADRLLPGRRAAIYRTPDPRLLRRTLRDFEADAVLAKVYSLRNVVALLVALTLRLRRVAWLEQVPPPNREWRILRRLGVLPRRMFTALDARHGGIADPLERPAGRMPVITYAPVIPAAVDRPASDGRPVRVLTVASFWDLEPKRAHWTLEAARDAGLLDGSAMFTFVGLGREESAGLVHLRRIIEDASAGDVADVRLGVSYREMPAVYDAHDLLVLPSSREQFGMAVPEAMAHGLAVIASDCIGSVGCIVPGVTGELFRATDRDELGRVLRALVHDPQRIARMGAAGREFIVRHGSPDVTAAMLERLLQR